MFQMNVRNGFEKKPLSGLPGIFGTNERKLMLSSAVGIAIFFLLVAVLADSMPLTGALLRITPGGTPSASGFYVSRNYEAQPSERGSIVVQSGQAFANFEGASFSIAVDPNRAEIIRARRTAITQQFDISFSYPAAGIVRVALVGAPRQISANAQLLELELQLEDSEVNRAGHRIDLRLLGTTYVSNGNQIGTTSSDGLITFVTNQDALTLPFTPSIADVDPGILPLVSAKELVIRGRAFPGNPRVLLGSNVIPVQSASSTEIVARVPENTAPGIYSVSVESLLAEEKVLVFGATSPAGSIDILEEMLFIDPNPILYSPSNDGGTFALWVPVYNPLGVTESIQGSVDFSSIGGDPNVIFSGIGTAAIGPGGERMNWFRVPATGSFTLEGGLETNIDYPITVRVENRAGSTDTERTTVSLRSQIPQGGEPSFGPLSSVPANPAPGEDAVFYVDVSDEDGVDSLSLVTLRLTALNGSVQEMEPAISIPSIPALRTAPFTTEFTIPNGVTPGTYQLELRAVDSSGNEAVRSVPFTVAPPGGQRGTAPQFAGRLEARPASTGPGGTVDFFIGVRDPDGTETIDLVTIDLVDIGGSILEMSPAVTSGNIGTLPITYEASFDLPSQLTNGTRNLRVRATDDNGLATETTIPLTIDSVLGGGGTGSPPIFQGRLETMPVPVGLGGLVKFFVSVRDPDGSDTLKKVSVDLVDIGGTELVLKPASDPVKGSVEPVLFTGEFNLPSSVPPGVYSLAVRAFDADGNATNRTLPLTVSATTPQTSVPMILQAVSIPAQVPADDETEVAFRIEVEDTDGIEDIAIARIDLTAIGLPITTLDLQSNTTAKGSTRGFFESKELTIPTFVKSGGYDLPVTVEDKKRNRVLRTLRLTVGGTVGGDAPAFRDSRFVPETVAPGADVKLYVEIEDLNGADADTLTVVADFTEVRQEIEELSDLINFPSGTLVTRNTFTSDSLTIPEDLPVGVYDVPLMVVDDTNNVVRTTARLRVEHGAANTGQEPRIDVIKTFQVPRVIANDGDKQGELHVLVQYPDDYFSTVIVNLGSIGRAQSASIRTEEGELELLCKSSNSIVCMERGALEGIGARWFILKDIEIPSTTIAGNDPYMLDITAVDKGGHAAEEQVPLLIGSPEDAAGLATEPTFELLVPVSATQLELVLSSPIHTSTVDRSGKQFVIRPALDAFSALAVQRVSWDTTGRYLYLQTDALVPGETYILTVQSTESMAGIQPLTDVRGNRFARDRGGKITFRFEQPGTTAPSIEKVTALDAEHIAVRFAGFVLPSSVHPDLLTTRTSLVSTVTGESRNIRKGILGEGGRVLLLTVDTLREGDRYRLRIAGVLAPGLIEAPDPGVEKVFVALFPQHNAAQGPLILPTADLNHDGKVDFADFALFSAVYNTEYDLQDIETIVPRDAAPEEGDTNVGFGTATPAKNKGNGKPLGGELPVFDY